MRKERRRRPGRLSKRNALKVEEARKFSRKTVRSRPSKGMAWCLGVRVAVRRLQGCGPRSLERVL
jgi:hypothetical protein